MNCVRENANFLLPAAIHPVAQYLILLLLHRLARLLHYDGCDTNAMLILPPNRQKSAASRPQRDYQSADDLHSSFAVLVPKSHPK